MKKSTKIWLTVAASLVVLGSIAFVGVMSALKWDFTKLSTNQYETNHYEISETVRSVSLDIDTADLKFVPSEDSKCSVICYEQNNMKHTVVVKDGTLEIKVVDTRKWYEYIGINFGTPKITVYMPEGQYETLSVSSHTGDVEISKDFTFQRMDISESTGDVTNYASVTETVTIKTSTGKIRLENLSAGALDLSVSTGDVTVSGVRCEGNVTIGVSTGKTYLTDLACENLVSSGDTGDMFLKNVIAAKSFSIERSTGDVSFDGCDASEIFVVTDTGDVEGSLLSEKVFLISTDTGKKEVPNTVAGGRCEITTDTGDIKITICT